MPTGYTADIAKDISFETFAMNCARACISMQDEPAGKEIPEFKPPTYNLEKLKEAKAELKKLKKISVMKASGLSEKEYKAAVVANEKVIKEKNILRKKYSAMLAKANEWQSPSSDHDKLKEFMRDQITKSIDFDCNTKYYLDNAPKLLTGEEWISAKIKDALRAIAYHSSSNNKEVDSVNYRNMWVAKLKTSLGI